MKRSIGLWQLMGFAVTSLAGTLLHFLYDWLGEALWIAPFSGVNESTFEHMKLLFWPMFLYAVVESFFFRDIESFWCVKLIGIVTGVILIPVLYYTIRGVFGAMPDWVNIAIFFVTAAVSYLLETKSFKQNSVECESPEIAFIILCLIALVLVILTFAPPHIPLFEDPVTGTYGYILKGM